MFRCLISTQIALLRKNVGVNQRLVTQGVLKQTSKMEETVTNGETEDRKGDGSTKEGNGKVASEG